MKQPGLIARFQELARVPAPNRQSLCSRTIEIYTFWLRQFGRFTKLKPASQWRGDAARGVSPLDAAPVTIQRRAQLVGVPLLQ